MRRISNNKFLLKKSLLFLAKLRNEVGPFKLRLRAVRSKLASKQAVVVCLRQILKHRGYDDHEMDGGSFPWGDELKADVATAWAKAAYCFREDAAEFIHDVSDCG